MSEPLPTPDRLVPSAAAAPTIEPRFRGVVHQWSFFVALVAGAALVAWAPAGRATAASAVYAVALAGLLGTSALYHRGTWRPSVRAWLRRLDHSMIFVLIAGTYTPFAVLVLDDPLGDIVLLGVWGGALAGIVFTMVWIDAPKWLTAAAYVALGWFSVDRDPADHRAHRRGSARTAGGGRSGLHGGRGRLRTPATRPPPGQLRLPRDLPRARGGGGGRALRGRGGVRAARGALGGAGRGALPEQPRRQLAEHRARRLEHVLVRVAAELVSRGRAPRARGGGPAPRRSACCGSGSCRAPR